MKYLNILLSFLVTGKGVLLPFPLQHQKKAWFSTRRFQPTQDLPVAEHMCRQHQTVLLDWDLCASSSIPCLTGAKTFVDKSQQQSCVEVHNLNSSPRINTRSEGALVAVNTAAFRAGWWWSGEAVLQWILLLKPDVSPVRREAMSTALAQLQLLQGCYTNMAVSWLCQKVYTHPWKAGLCGRVI